MKKYMVLYMGPVSAEEQMNVNEEEKKKGMEPWVAWFKKLGNALIEGGTPLVNGMHFTKDDLSHTKTEVTGYSIVQADDWEALKALLVDHPHYLIPNTSLEVFEMMPMQ